MTELTMEDRSQIVVEELQHDVLRWLECPPTTPEDKDAFNGTVEVLEYYWKPSDREAFLQAHGEYVRSVIEGGHIEYDEERQAVRISKWKDLQPLAELGMNFTIVRAAFGDPSIDQMLKWMEYGKDALGS